MKKYIVEEEESFNGGEEFDNLSEAIYRFKKILQDYSTYNYQINKDKIFTLSYAEYDTDKEVSCYETYDILATCSIANYRDMNSEDKDKLFDIKEK